MALVPAIIATFVCVGSSWLLVAALVAGVRTRRLWPAGRSVLFASALLLMITLVPHMACFVVAAEAIVWMLSGIVSDTLAWARTPAYAAPGDILFFRLPLAARKARAAAISAPPPAPDAAPDLTPAIVALNH